MTWMTELPPPLAKALKAETKGELVTWTGQPHAARSFVFSAPIWLFAVPWTTFSLFMMGTMAAGPLMGKQVPESFGTWGVSAVFAGMIFMVPFVAIGFLMMSAPFWAYFTARQTVYAITDKRLIILNEGRHRKVQGIEPDTMRQFTRTESTKGSGSLKITLGFTKDSDGDTVETQETLWYVPNVRRAEQLLQALRQKTKV